MPLLIFYEIDRPNVPNHSAIVRFDIKRVHICDSRMTSDPLHRAIYLTGPTASGKTAVGVALAHRIGAEVLALDSMTLYRGMDIGTAKPSIDERQGIPHHLIDVLDPWESASVADYRSWAIAKVLEVESRGRKALFVGGTPMYLKVLLRGIFEGPPADNGLRMRLETEASEALHAHLSSCDPASAARLHLNDRRRLIRAIEVFELTGKPLSSYQIEHDQPATGVHVFALEPRRDLLYQRINERVHQMFRVGLIDEVRRLQSSPRPLSQVAAQGVGYRETIAHLSGSLSLAATIDAIQTRTRQFAKRQGTWFRSLSEVTPWPMSDSLSPERTAAMLAVAIGVIT